jgi:hypothetical protein
MRFNVVQQKLENITVGMGLISYKERAWTVIWQFPVAQQKLENIKAGKGLISYKIQGHLPVLNVPSSNRRWRTSHHGGHGTRQLHVARMEGHLPVPGVPSCRLRPVEGEIDSAGMLT